MSTELEIAGRLLEVVMRVADEPLVLLPVIVIGEYRWGDGAEMGKPLIFSPSFASGCLRFAAALNHRPSTSFLDKTAEG